MTIDSKATGRQGESLAQVWMQRQGFCIEAVNWRSGRLGEIDLVAFHPQARILAFIEVKARRTTSMGAPIEAVDARKQIKLLRLAEVYLEQHPQPPDVQLRFDVIGILYPGHGHPPEICHVENAFET